MRRLVMGVAAGVLAAALSSAAFAADVGSRRYQPYQPVPAKTWQGLYVGLQGGLESQTSNLDVGFDGFGNIASTSARNAGATGGVVLGYRWETANRLVYGVEGDWMFGGPRATGSLFGVSGSVKDSWNGSVRGVLGYAVSPDLLIYTTAGAQFDHYRYFVDDGFGLTESWSQTVPGWTAGIGADYKITDNWFAGVQWRYGESRTGHHEFAVAPGLNETSSQTKQLLLVRVGYQF